ncbi:hypothetical protein Sa4125_10520 [Aureimonas sp. SA4125]|nr:hypothetical protein Sa4125_10520 [Aureimonas sp. SA4125]
MADRQRTDGASSIKRVSIHSCDFPIMQCVAPQRPTDFGATLAAPSMKRYATDLRTQPAPGALPRCAGLSCRQPRRVNSNRLPFEDAQASRSTSTWLQFAATRVPRSFDV